MRYLILLFLFVSLLSVSCSYKQDQYLFEQKAAVTGVKPTDSASNITNYRIRPQDILQITNVQNNRSIINEQAGVLGVQSGMQNNANNSENNNNTYTVDDDGTIGLPVLGRIQIAGLTRTEARKRIEELYSKELKQPLLDVKIVNLKVTIAGEVKIPGNIALVKDRTTLIEVIGQAGGLTDKADEKTVKIIRTNQHSKIDQLDLSNINTLSDPRIYVQNDDIVYVLQNKKAVRNANLQNFSLIVQPVLLVINAALIIYTFAHR
ncbi:polysaccharide biosynthesis/export family protein [Mucilaginibacter ximonensis]|uniref:Polysaccharide biosynthesis/export family protein n=1 Tax=Mucilaginibacter ximonensis TaxID=538021 RepID=A0ABW5Y6E3_9SPHI